MEFVTKRTKLVDVSEWLVKTSKNVRQMVNFSILHLKMYSYVPWQVFIDEIFYTN